MVGCAASAWLYAQGPFALLPAEISGGQRAEERVIIDGERFLAEVVRLGDGWRVIIASDCVALGGKEPEAPLVLHRPAQRVAAGGTSGRARRGSGDGDV